jgi:hypothetical protein
MQADPCSQSIILDANRDSIAESRRTPLQPTWGHNMHTFLTIQSEAF